MYNRSRRTIFKLRKVIGMKIEKINDNKIKVTLSTTELKERNLDFQALRYNTPEAQTLFWDMMKQAENEHGFKTTNCQLFIEAASINDGQFIVTVTKLQTKALPPVPQKKKLPTPELKVRKKQPQKPQNFIYKFDDFEQICNLLSAIKAHSDIPSTLYEYKGAFFIVSNPPKQLHLIISEFGEIIKDSIAIEGILQEHGKKLIPKNAFDKLMKSFK